MLQNVGNAWANLAVFAASIEAGDQQIRAAQTAFDGVREEATLGARTTLDVLNAEQELLDARAARLQAEAGRYVAVYQVLSSMGLLTVDHLNLGIATYDPEAYYDAVKDAPATSCQGKRLDADPGKDRQLRPAGEVACLREIHQSLTDVAPISCHAVPIWLKLTGKTMPRPAGSITCRNP